jgi:hypothetical protein
MIRIFYYEKKITLLDNRSDDVADGVNHFDEIYIGVSDRFCIGAVNS